ncbi:Multidrug resistance protein MdtB [Planctomycetes bacterium Pan216]|uniref:Multidrug resistance protein MdtB n=1 Tax=Kolteria novifilia TaxID=2527975 RepID=A0A518B5X3_9BACT|nr:Multidrug resistance protein MdtB [Planctomycetes bacterium Pan216]
MSVSELFIRRPVMTCLIMAGMVFFGIFSYLRLPIADLPVIDYPTIEVLVAYPGASPDRMASLCAAPLEQQLTMIPDLQSMTSRSTQGQTEINLQFGLNKKMEQASVDVQAAVQRSLNDLPADLPAPPQYYNVNPTEYPILYITLTSETLPLTKVCDLARLVVANRFERQPGVAQVQFYGERRHAVRVQLDPRKLAVRQLGINEIMESLAEANTMLPTGQLKGKITSPILSSDGELDTAERFARTIVAYQDEAPIRVGDLGRVIDSVINDQTECWFNHQPCVTLGVQREAGANTLSIIEGIKTMLPEIEEELPAGVNIIISGDESVSIRQSMVDLKLTVIVAIIMVVLFIALFLQRPAATFISATAIPFSLVCTFAFMELLGFSLDNLSMMALTLSIGFVVDDAIVMLENIVRHIEMGKGRLEAAVSGSNQITLTLVSMTLSLCIVFVPILFLSGLLGRLLNEFAWTIVITILISGFVSISLTPMLCSRFLRTTTRENRLPIRDHRHQPNARGKFRVFLNIYEWLLRRTIHHPVVTMIIAALTLAWTIHLFIIIPKGFVPDEDLAKLHGFTVSRTGTSFEEMTRLQQQVISVLLDDPNVSTIANYVGNDGITCMGTLYMNLIPRSQRSMTIQEVAESLREKGNTVPGIEVFLRIPPTIPINTTISKASYQYELTANSTDRLYPTATKLLDAMKQIPEIQAVSSELYLDNPTLKITIDRERAERLGVSAADIQSTLDSAFSSRLVNRIYGPSLVYQLLIEVMPEFQEDPASLELLYVESDDGRLVPLDAVVHVEKSRGPLIVDQSGGVPSVTISFEVPEDVALSDAIDKVEMVADEHLGDGVTGRFQGTAQAFRDSLTSFQILIVLSLVLVYILLGTLYESFFHPLTILFGLPSAAIGGLLTLFLFGYELDFYGFLGIVILIGIVKKNAIMVVDFALEAIRSNPEHSPTRAAFQGSVERFRPIIMTTGCAIAGALPIALGFGAGAEARRPLGLVVVGGLAVSQVFTLFFTPVFFIAMERLERWFKGKSQHALDEL